MAWIGEIDLGTKPAPAQAQTMVSLTIDGTAVKFDPQLHQEIVDLYESNY